MLEEISSGGCEFIGDCERHLKIIPGMEHYCETKQCLDCIGRLKKLYDDKSFVTRDEITQALLLFA